MADEIYAAVTNRITDLAETVDTFHTYSLYHATLPEDATVDTVERSREKTVDAWIDAEYQRRQVDTILREPRMETTVAYTDGDTGERYEDRVTIQSIQDLLHTTNSAAFPENDAFAVDPPTHYAEQEVTQMLDAVTDWYDTLAETNRTYIEALDHLTDTPAVVREKHAATTLAETPPDAEYREIEELLLQLADQQETPA